MRTRIYHSHRPHESNFRTPARAVGRGNLGCPDVDRLAILWSTDTEKGIREQPLKWEIAQAALEHGHSFEAFGFFQGNGFRSPISALMLTAALTAAFVPVHRMTRIDPQQALRHD